MLSVREDLGLILIIKKELMSEVVLVHSSYI